MGTLSFGGRWEQAYLWTGAGIMSENEIPSTMVRRIVDGFHQPAQSSDRK